MIHNFETVWATQLSYKKSFDNQIIIYLELEALGRSMIFITLYALSKSPYFTP